MQLPGDISTCGATAGVFAAKPQIGQRGDRNPAVQQVSRWRVVLCGAGPAAPKLIQNNSGLMGWMAPLRHLSAKLLSDRNSSEWEPSMGEVTTIGLDLA